MSRWHDVMDSPVGPLTITMSADGVTGVFFAKHRHPVDPALLGDRDSDGATDVRAQLEEYFDGDRREFDLPLAPEGTEFQLAVWDALLRIPYGQTAGYGELAAWIGKPTASRAVGAANGRNPISIIVPCHRVIGASGDLTGYGGGLERKRTLLDLEQRAGRLF